MTIKKVRAILLCCTVICGLSTSHHAFAMNNETESNGNATAEIKEKLESIFKHFTQKKDWRKKLLWLLAPVLIQVTLAKIITPIIDKFYNQQDRDLKMLQDLILINKELKLQLDYIKKHCHDSRLIRKIENDYLETCIKVMELQKKYHAKYTYNKHRQRG